MASSRRERYEAREVVRSVTTLPRVGRCGRSVVREAGVQLRVSADGTAGLAGVGVCGSVHACPVCASKILSGRTREVGDAVAAWLRGGEDRSVAMVTLTVRHGRRSRLREMLDGMQGAWVRVFKSSVFGKERRSLGWRFQIRALEARYGRNGWHPHFHVLVFLDRDLSAESARDSLEALSGALFSTWRAAVEAEGLGRVSAKGFDFRVLAGDRECIARDAGLYVTKGHYGSELSEDARRIAWEITRGDRKGSRLAGSVAPFELLTAMVSHLRDSGGDAGSITRLRRVWVEWERATKGRRQLTWSRGLRDAVGLGTARADEELAAEELGTAEDAVLEMTARDYRRLARMGTAGVVGLLEVAESGWREDGKAGAWREAGLWLRARGVTPRPPVLRRPGRGPG